MYVLYFSLLMMNTRVASAMTAAVPVAVGACAGVCRWYVGGSGGGEGFEKWCP